MPSLERISDPALLKVQASLGATLFPLGVLVGFFTLGGRVLELKGTPPNGLAYGLAIAALLFLGLLCYLGFHRATAEIERRLRS